jgi:hypothetical protein
MGKCVLACGQGQSLDNITKECYITPQGCLQPSDRDVCEVCL